ncbi:MAG: hypothetical protein LUP95_04710, partial [Euryarchaeota archaeon]|nr:hypothetical protein [Euryarchaeota archaeon]
MEVEDAIFPNTKGQAIQKQALPSSLGHDGYKPETGGATDTLGNDTIGRLVGVDVGVGVGVVFGVAVDCITLTITGCCACCACCAPVVACAVG